MVTADRCWLAERITLDQEEVDAAMWLSPVLARLVAEDAVPEDCPSQLQATVLDTNGDQKDVMIDSSVMTNKVSHYQVSDTGTTTFIAGTECWT